jgi:hypothetical protein
VKQEVVKVDTEAGGIPLGFRTRKTLIIGLLLLGGVVLPAQELRPFQADTKLWGYQDQNGKEVVPAKYVRTFLYAEGMAIVQATADPVYGYIDLKGDEVISPKFINASGFSEGLAAVELLANAHWGFIDKTGKTVISFKYKGAGSFSGGLAPVNEVVKETGQRRWGFIDQKGQTVIPFQYQKAGNFSEGLAAVCLFVEEANKDMWGFINRSGKIVLPFEFDDVVGYPAPVFAAGKAKVWRDGKHIYIDKTGKSLGIVTY